VRARAFSRYAVEMECRRSYDSDLTDAEWSRLEPLVPAPKHGGRPAKHTRREILNGICYAIRSGGAWKMLPHDLPAWRTVYHYFWSWHRIGIWGKINDTVRGWARQAAGRECQPSAAVLDSQSVRTSEQGARGATMAPRTCVDVNAICWWIRSAWCFWWWSRRPMCKTATERARYCRFWH
jgi:transposase